MLGRRRAADRRHVVADRVHDRENWNRHQNEKPQDRQDQRAVYPPLLVAEVHEDRRDIDPFIGAMVSATGAGTRPPEGELVAPTVMAGNISSAAPHSM